MLAPEPAHRQKRPESSSLVSKTRLMTDLRTYSQKLMPKRSKRNRVQESMHSNRECLTPKFQTPMCKILLSLVTQRASLQPEMAKQRKIQVCKLKVNQKDNKSFTLKIPLLKFYSCLDAVFSLEGILRQKLHIFRRLRVTNFPQAPSTPKLIFISTKLLTTPILTSRSLFHLNT